MNKIMKTIEERAREASYANLDRLSPAFEEGYIKGATEQQEIDYEHYISLLEKKEYQLAIIIDKACEQFAEALEDLRVKNVDEYVKCFRKAMKGE